MAQTHQLITNKNLSFFAKQKYIGFVRTNTYETNYCVEIYSINVNLTTY